ncbi:siderophore-interacting protein [Kribbella speibonae]|uniref:Siderophore-interacting protein n=1 Tax=Kribbella speibonae TaxID=1572660 RepID=A0ABY1ZT01_9ACTN|nr:siderophore-interacting protein [Kribbella speibonae]TCC16537.1 siderophore-interacting protein [Kribbella speibonae]
MSRDDLQNRDNPRERVEAHHQAGEGVTRIPYPIGIRTAVVARTTYLTAHMVRVTLTGEGLAGFHSYHCDDHVKIVFPDPDGTLRLPVPNDRQLLDWPRPFPPTRSYTVRRYDGTHVDLDFVVHNSGLASPWAEALRPGDKVAIAGPPGGRAFPYTHPHYVFAVDPTGLPAAARWLDEAPSHLSADVVVEIDHPDESAYPLATRANTKVHWIPRGALATHVLSLAVPPRTFLFAAGEADALRPLRPWPKADAVIRGYWKRGEADHEDH